MPRAARVAALITAETGIEPVLAVGNRGEFTVRVGEEVVAKKDANGFPGDEEIVAAVRRALELTDGV